MMTVSAVARLIPRPPALVESRKTNWSAPGAGGEGDIRTPTWPPAGLHSPVQSETPTPHRVGANLTVEAVDGLLPHAACDAPVNPLVLVTLVLQEVLQQVQHLRHLGEEEEGNGDSENRRQCRLSRVNPI